MFCGVIYCGLLCLDLLDLGFGWNFLGLDEDSDIGEILDVFVCVVVVGNLVFEFFLFWNVDIVIEWYLNEDIIFVFGLYYKSFEGGFLNMF